MNLLELNTDLINAGINPRIFSIDYDKKEIKLSIDSADIRKLLEATDIMEKHYANLKTNGFKLVINYTYG